MLFVQSQQGLGLFFFIVPVIILNLFNLRLQALHQRLIFGAFIEEWKKNNPHQNRQNNYRETQIVERQILVDKNQNR